MITPTLSVTNAYRQLPAACNRFVARLLIVACFLLSIRPAVPLIMDQLAHRYYPQQHFRLVHAHGGKNHVHTEIQKSLKDEMPGSKSLMVKISLEDWNHSAFAEMIFLQRVAVLSAQKFYEFGQRFDAFRKGPEAPPPWGEL